MFLDGYDEPLYDCPADVVTAYVILLKMYIFLNFYCQAHNNIIFRVNPHKICLFANQAI